MHDLVKSTLKEILPPGLVRLLQPKDRSLDAWGTPRYGLHGLKLPGGQRFEFRPSVPDRAVCRQIFFSTRLCYGPSSPGAGDSRLLSGLFGSDHRRRRSQHRG
jgi:hypothetical protein